MRAGHQRAQDLTRLTPWARLWTKWMDAAFCGGYLATPGVLELLPGSVAEQRLLLDFYRVEKCIYEVSYELNNRPEWLPIPIRGLLEMIGVEPPPPRPVVVKD